MKVTAERIPDAQVVLDVELDDDQVQHSLDLAARRLAQRFRIPGFRKGKAPRAIVERSLGAEAVFDEAVERLIPEIYDQAVKEQGLEPVGPPAFEILERQPVRFKATVPVQPDVGLHDYQAIAVPRDSVEITEEMVTSTILELRRQHAVLEPVERPVGYNDHLKLDIQAEVEGKTVLNETGVEFPLREGGTVGLPGVTEKIIGLTGAEPHEFEISVPEDYEDAEVAGKTVQFTLTIHDIKQENLPDADDDLAQEVGEFDSMVVLQQRVEEDLQASAERRAQDAHYDALVAAVSEGATVEFPPLMVDHELDHMLRDIARQSGQDLDSYVQQLGQNVEQIRSDLRPQARERVRRSLILTEIAEAEDVTVTDVDIDAEVTTLIGESPQASKLQDLFTSEDGLQAIRNNLLTRRTLERLAEIALSNVATTTDAATDTATDATPGAESTAAPPQGVTADTPDASPDTETAVDEASEAGGRGTLSAEENLNL